MGGACGCRCRCLGLRLRVLGAPCKIRAGTQYPVPFAFGSGGTHLGYSSLVPNSVTMP